MIFRAYCYICLDFFSSSVSSQIHDATFTMRILSVTNLALERSSGGKLIKDRKAKKVLTCV